MDPGLGARIDAWLAEGIISAEQAARIRDLERRTSAPLRRVSLIAESTIYLGAALAVAAGVALLAERYDDLSRPLKVSVAFGLTVILLGAGWPLRRSEEPAVDRLASMLWALSALGLGWSLNELIRPEDEAGRWTFLLVGVGSGAYAIALYAAFRRHATQLAGFAGGWAAIGGIVAGLVGTDEAFGIAFGLAACAFSVIWFTAGRAGKLPPPPFAMALGTLGALLAPLWLIDRIGLTYLVAIAVAAGLVAASAGARSSTALVLAALGLFVYVFAAIMEYLADSIGAPLALLLVGVALISIALLTIRLSRGRT